MSSEVRVLLLIIVAWGALAPIQPVQARSDVAAARAKFQEGQKLFDNHQYSDAATMFREAYDMSPNWRLLYNIAQSEAAATQYGMALETFEQYLSSGGDDVPPSRQEEVRSEIRRLRDLVGILMVKTHAGAEVFVDGIFRGQAPIHGGISVTSGQRLEVEVRYDGEVLPVETVRVRGGQTVELTMLSGDGPEPVEGEEDAGEEPTAEPLKTGNPLRTTGLILSAVGGAGVLAGAITGGVAIQREKELKQNCVDSICPRENEGTIDARDRLALTSTILFGVGSAAVVSGVVLMVIGNRRGREQLTLLPLLSPGVAGVGVQWTL